MWWAFLVNVEGRNTLKLYIPKSYIELNLMEGDIELVVIYMPRKLIAWDVGCWQR